MPGINGCSQSSMPFSTWGTGESSTDFISRYSANTHADAALRHSTAYLGTSPFYRSVDSVSSTDSDSGNGRRSQKNANFSQPYLTDRKVGPGQNFFGTPASHQAPSERLTESDTCGNHASHARVQGKKNHSGGCIAFLRNLLPCVNDKKSDN